MRIPALFGALSVLIVLAGGVAPPVLADTVPVITPTIIETLPHDPGAYSEGLEFDGPDLYESTGEVGKSQIRQVDPNTGAVLRAADLPPSYFGEGFTVVGDQIWQLVYQKGTVIVWDKATLTPLREVRYDGQGWGLCSDGGRFIRTDGTDQLFFHDLATFAQTGAITVTKDGQPLSNLDEIECVDGQVWAAWWPYDAFVRIDPATGVVNTVVDTSSLWQFGDRGHRQVVSAIAHITGDEYLISGKEWPQNVKVRLDPPN